MLRKQPRIRGCGHMFRIPLVKRVPLASSRAHTVSCKPILIVCFASCHSHIVPHIRLCPISCYRVHIMPHILSARGRAYKWARAVGDTDQALPDSDPTTRGRRVPNSVSRRETPGPNPRPSSHDNTEDMLQCVTDGASVTYFTVCN